MFFNRKKKAPQPPRRPELDLVAEPSFIGRNCTFEGHITCDGELHIDGTVRGSVQAGMCVVDEAGVVHGSVTGEVLHIRGRVLGPLQGSNIFIHAGAHVEGDVYNDTISIENGAYIYGSIRHNATVSKSNQNTSMNGSQPMQPAPQPAPQLQPPPQQQIDIVPGLRVIASRKK